MALRFHKVSLTLALLAAGGVPVYAQQQAPAAPQSAPVAPATSAPAQTPAPLSAPQVSSVIHRLSGFKMLTLLRRNGARVAPLNDELLVGEDVHTSITAGFFLADGQ
ncbi:MAG: hypothetical protein JO360_07995, partial [Acidobacteria bacterium]|nr:hypothetical protein [Acidobacteriota bacterium]